MSRSRREVRQDRRLFARLAEGDMAALEQIYTRHAEGLFAQALWLTRSRADAEDLVQTVLTKLCGLGARLLSVRSPGAYLRRMLHHAATDNLRRGARAQPLACPADDIADLSSANGETRAELALLARLLNDLPVAQREVLYLRLHEQRSFREIGKITNVSIYTAASRYRLALKKLRRKVGFE